MSGRKLSIVAPAAAGLLWCSPILAADMAQPLPVEAPAEDHLTFAAAPYLWMAGVKGNVGQFGLPAVAIDASFTDILENFEFGFMGAGEMRHGRFAVFVDVAYTRLSANAATPNGVLADSIDVESQMFTGLAAGSYRLFEGEGGHLDALAGGRLWWVDTTLTPVNPGPLLDRSFQDGDTWVDPVIGVKGRVNLSAEAYLTGWAMIGGFGAGSELTWDVMGGAGYAVTERASIVGGYRALSVDYENDGFVFDVVQHGPFLGVNFAF